MTSLASTSSGSLLKKLTLRLAGVTLAAAVALILALYLQLNRAIDTLHDRSLSGQAQDIARHLKALSGGVLRLELPEDLASAYYGTSGQHVFQVRRTDGALLFASKDGASVLGQIRPEGDGETEYFLLQDPSKGKIYAASVWIEGPSGPLNIRVGQSSSHDDVLVDELVQDFFGHIGWAMIPILLVLLLVNVITLRHGLAPLKLVSAQAATIDPNRTDVRLFEEGVPEEIRPLVRSVNGALERLEGGFRMQRDFTADAAHELRTPIAVLNAHLDTLDDQQVAKSLKEDVTNISRVADQLLQAAQLESFAVKAGEQTDLRAMAEEVAAYLAPLAQRRDRALEVTGEEGPVMVAGNKTALYHAARNLAENALAHTPPGTTVKLEVDKEGALRVIDRGPGVPEAERELIFDRFRRGKFGRTKNTGSGLGLHIVARTAKAHNGNVSVRNAPGGGACFTLKLPKA